MSIEDHICYFCHRNLSGTEGFRYFIASHLRDALESDADEDDKKNAEKWKATALALGITASIDPPGKEDEVGWKCLADGHDNSEWPCEWLTIEYGILYKEDWPEEWNWLACLCGEMLPEKPFYLSIKMTEKEDGMLRQPFCSKLCRWTVAHALGKELLSRYPDAGHSICVCTHTENGHWSTTAAPGELQASFGLVEAVPDSPGHHRIIITRITSATAKLGSCSYEGCPCQFYVERDPVILQGASVGRIGE